LGNLVQHEVNSDELDALKSRVPLEKIFEYYRILEEAEMNLFSNVNPGLVLEDVAVRL